MKISVLGCGRWGTFIATYLDGIGHNVTLWGRETSKNYQSLSETRRNDYLQLSDSLKISNSLEETIDKSDVCVISISAQELRNFAKQLNELTVTGKTFVLCMKGLEASSGKRLTQVMVEEMSQPINLAIWVGPGHVQDFIKGIPNCMVISSNDIIVTKDLVNAFTSGLIRFYYGQDLIGNEIGAATKNVVGLAAGMLDGLGYGSLKGSLMARGTREISRLVRAMGGNDMTIYGLSHLGDYEATLFSEHSHNRKYGQRFVEGSPFEKLAEGVSTVKALKELSEQYHVELPICDALYEILFNKKDAKETLETLILRPIKFEF